MRQSLEETPWDEGKQKTKLSSFDIVEVMKRRFEVKEESSYFLTRCVACGGGFLFGMSQAIQKGQCAECGFKGNLADIAVKYASKQ